MVDDTKTREDFDTIDTDDDGYITVNELQEYHKNDARLSEANIATIARMADEDGNQKVTYEEYAKFVR
jgi:Ca2+-binding EF-hand superfamily protein